jgi:hypothetical protein
MVGSRPYLECEDDHPQGSSHLIRCPMDREGPGRDFTKDLSLVFPTPPDTLDRVKLHNKVPTLWVRQTVM